MIPILVVKSEDGDLYHLRMDRPFSQPIAKLITVLSSKSDENPRMIGSMWIEEMTEEAYSKIDSLGDALREAPSFITNE